MVRLFYSPISNGIASFIAAYISSVYIECEVVNNEHDLTNYKTSSGMIFSEINKEGKLPCLLFDDGQALSEEPVILEYIADKVAGKIAPHYGTKSRYEVNQFLSSIKLNFYAPINEISNPNLNHELKEHFKVHLNTSLQALNEDIHKNPRKCAVGNELTIADTYLYAIILRMITLNINLSHYIYIENYYDMMSSRPEIKAAVLRMQQNPSSTIDLPSDKCMWLPTLCG